ncbi:hypothetical protein F5H01DRAFT_339757 [Linnemannia elongata]|nr:hypothetical protein F5H01DRAFT_339757 [Linnemannia elongata]
MRDCMGAESAMSKVIVLPLMMMAILRVQGKGRRDRMRRVSERVVEWRSVNNDVGDVVGGWCTDSGEVQHLLVDGARDRD